MECGQQILINLHQVLGLSCFLYCKFNKWAAFLLHYQVIWIIVGRNKCWTIFCPSNFFQIPFALFLIVVFWPQQFYIKLSGFIFWKHRQPIDFLQDYVHGFLERE